MNTKESMAAADTLLHYQLEEDTDQVRNLVNDLHKLLKKLVPKRNCMEVVSPPSSGKIYFFDPVVSFLY